MRVISLLEKFAHLVFFNHNPVDGERMVSFGHEGPNWADANHRVGANCVGQLDLSSLFGVISDWFCCFQDQDNGVVKSISNIFKATSDFFFGVREADMYTGIYSAGIDKVSDEDIKDQGRMKDEPFIDDYLENANILKDRVINKFWRATTWISKWEPGIFILSPFLGRKWSDLIFSLCQTMSRATWRLTYFMPATFHNNVIETWWDLGRLKFMSIFSRNAQEEYKTFAGNLEKMAREYDKKVYPEKSEIGNRSGTSAYMWMLGDRMEQQRKGIFDPEAVLEEKVKSGQLEGEFTLNEGEIRPEEKSLEKGWTIPDSPEDKAFQKRISLVNYTAPFCAIAGLIGTLIFEPLRCLWDVCGFEKGKGLISMLANIRGPASLINYTFKFFLPEKEAGEQGYNKWKNYIKDGTANETVYQLYKAAKGRMLNGYFGIGLLGASFVDTFGQMFRSFEQESRSENFLYSLVSRFVGTGFVRYFSARRRDWGLTEKIYLALEKLGIEAGKLKPEEFVEKVKGISDEQFLKTMESLGFKSDEGLETYKPKSSYDPLVARAVKVWEGIFGGVRPAVQPEVRLAA